jgi:hypothetical protein
LKSRYIFIPALLATLLAACGGDTSPETTSTVAQQGATRAAQQPGHQLDQPLTNADAQRAAPTSADRPGSQQKRSALSGTGAGLSIDTSDREAVRVFFNRVYVQPDVPMGWTGNYQTGDAGTVSAAFQAATIRRLNWYRAMAGLPADVTLSAESSAKDQQAALIMSANGQLSHTPPADWKFYTQIGAEAAGKSNLALGGNGPAAIDQYIADFGDNNFPVGHRRWIFYPQTRMFGSGDVPPMDLGGGTKVYGANALWVFDGNYSAPRPHVRDDFVAWPARGFMPYSVVVARWSFSYPNADFSNAQVAVTRDGNPASVTLEKVSNGIGEPTIVWQVAGIGANLRHDRPVKDVRYHVVVSGVTVAQQTRSFEYDVTVFDPAVETPGAVRAQVTAPALVQAGAAYQVQAAAAPNATGYELLSYRRKPLTQLAASDYNSATWTVGPHASVGTIGNGALALYHDGIQFVPLQSAALNKKLFVDPAGGAVSFVRALGSAMSAQVFHVQVSTDDGSSWQDVHTEFGQCVTPSPAATVRVPLNAYAGRQIALRFTEGSETVSYIGANTGWTVSAIGFEGVSEMVDEQRFHSANGTFDMPASQPGSYVLVPKIEYQDAYVSDGGSAALVAVDGAVLHGARSSYTLTRANGVLTIRDNAGQDGIQIVHSPFRLDFTDGTLAFDVDGNAGKAYRLYRAAFNRKSDDAGLGFWVRALDGGAKLEAMAEGFVRSDEFRSLYGTAPSHADIVTALYKNVLHRAPDEAGAAYWLQQMTAGLSVENVLIQFSESKENKDQVAPEVELGIGFTRH